VIHVITSSGSGSDLGLTDGRTDGPIFSSIRSSIYINIVIIIDIIIDTVWPHRSTMYVDAAYCCDGVASSFCLLVCHNREP